MYIGQVVVISKKTSFFSHCVFLFRISLSDPSVVPVVRIYEKMSCEESKNIVNIAMFKGTRFKSNTAYSKLRSGILYIALDLCKNCKFIAIIS